MPDPKSDADQFRFAQIRSRMIEGLCKNLPEFFVESAGAKTRDGLKEKLLDSPIILSIIECCAYEAQSIEEERAHVKRI